MLSDDRLAAIADAVAAVPGIVAVVLGGSRARGTHHPDSDVDLGLYYDAATLDLPALAAAAAGIHGAPVEVAGPGGWGPWVDGGAWLRVDDTPVDLILRDVDRVREQCGRAGAGEFGFHWQLGHPLGFCDIAYAAEIACCRPLVDTGGLINRLRGGLDPYPPALRTAFVRHLENAAFLVAGAAKVAGRGDVAFGQLCCASALLWCAHAWHAAAGVWVTTEKGLLPAVDRLPLDTAGFGARGEAALSAVGSTPQGGPAEHAVAVVADLVAETQARLGDARDGGVGPAD